MYVARLLLISSLLLLSSCKKGGDSPKPSSTTGKTSSTGIAAPDITLDFGIYATDQADTVIGEHRPTLDALEAGLADKLGKTVKISTRLSNTYEGGVDQIVNGDVDFAKLGPASYILAKKQNPALRLLAQEAKGGKKVFKGIIAVHKDSPISSLSELKGKSFAFGDEQSTIGRYLSQQQLVEAGVLGSDLSNYEYLERHDIVGEAVGAKKFDAGALKESTFKKQKAAGVPIKQLMAFENITKPWIAASDLDPKIAEALSASLLELKDEAALKALRTGGFVASTDSEYDFVRDGMQKSEFFTNKAK